MGGHVIGSQLISNVVRRFFLAMVLTGLLTGSVGQAASYQKKGGTIVDPILNKSGIAHYYSGPNFEPYADLTSANLRYAYLTGADLSYTALTNTTLTGANLTNANLWKANLTDANLTGVSSGGIIGTTSDLPTDWQITEGYLIGPEANLSGASLYEADLTGAVLTNANLPDANLQGANLTRANLTNANLTAAHLSYANLTAAHLFNANLTAAHLFNAGLSDANLTYAILSDANFDNANMARADLTYANLTLARMTDADLSNADLTSANLRYAYLTGADLIGADLLSSDLYYANLTSANLPDADLTSANLSDANLTRANLYSVDLTGAWGVEISTGSPYYYGNTLLPFGFDPVAQGWTLAPYCDFTPDAVCDLADINQMFDVGNLKAGVATTVSNDRLDLIDDDTLDAADISEWLSQAATANGHGSPYLRGDTEFDRDVDITDFNTLAANFGSRGAWPVWDEGNFNGDRDIDITDFNLLAANFAPTGYATSAIPEPSTMLLASLALIFVGVCFR